MQYKRYNNDGIFAFKKFLLRALSLNIILDGSVLWFYYKRVVLNARCMSVLCASYKMAELTFIKINWQFLTT